MSIIALIKHNYETLYLSLGYMIIDIMLKINKNNKKY